MLKVKRFTAQWCLPCQNLAPIMEDIKSQYPNVVFETIDIDDNPESVSEYGIRGVPLVVLEKGDTIIERFVGVQQRNVYENAINNQLEN